MRRSIAAVALVLSAGCATLDPTRPIEKGTGLSWGATYQDGRQLEFWGTRARLLDYEVSRSAARRSILESYVQVGVATAAVAVMWTGAATDRQAMVNAGLGIAALSFIPGFMATSDYLSAVDRYNSRFGPPRPSDQVVIPFVAPVGGGGAAGVAGRF